MSFLRAHGAAFSFTDRHTLFEDASFQLDPGWTGVVGPNGSGKSTLLQLLAGTLQPTEGHIQRSPVGLRVHLCAQAVEHVEAGVHALAEREDGDARKLMARLGLDRWALDRWAQLSPGERKRWQVAAALAQEPDVLLLDEPTNHLDAQARTWLLAGLAAFRGIGAVVSHDRELLAALTTRTLRVEGGEVRLRAGSYDAAREEEVREQAAFEAEREKLKGKLARVDARLHTSREAHAGAARMRSAGARMRNKHDSEARSLGADFHAEQAEKKVGRAVERLRGERARIEGELEQRPMTRALGGDLKVRVEESGGARLVALDLPALEVDGVPLLRDVHAVVGRGERIWISGPNGAGKTSLLKRLLAASPEAGTLYLPQELDAEAALAELEEVRDLPRAERGARLACVAALGVDPDALLASEQPSPGEARKLVLARGLTGGAQLLLLDEPTNHLDLPSVERLEAALSAYPGALVLVSHDARLAGALTQVEWHLTDGRVQLR